MESGRTGRCDVLIVGAGPTGLTLALALLRYGLVVRVVDALPGPTPWSKAQVLHTRTLEVLEQLSAIDGFLLRGRALHLVSMYAQDLRRIVHFTVGEFDSTYPYMLSLPQRDTEEILIEYLHRAGLTVERSCQFLSLQQSDGGVTVELLRGDTAEREQVHAAWVVGCDGAHSAVRGAIGVTFEESGPPLRVLQADVRIDWPLAYAEDEVVGFVSEHGHIGAFPLPSPQRYRLMVFDDGLAPTLENFQFLLQTRGPVGARLSEPHWLNENTVHRGQASRFRVGRVFLAGDAAHAHSPATGQGMNAGMQDAFNLAWKLAMVQRGVGRDVLLDSYEAERVPVAAELLRTTDLATRGLNDLFTIYGAVGQGVRNTLLHFVGELGLVRRSVSRNLSMLDVSYRDSPIVGQHHGSRAEQAGRGDAIGLRDWIDFGHGPTPGQRAVDGRVVDVGRHEHTRLFTLLHGGRHVLLLFAGAQESEPGYGRLVEIGHRVREWLGDSVDVYLVQIDPTTAAATYPLPTPWDGARLHDEHGTLHQAYGARAECVYLIRPDGHIGYRCQPADVSRVREYIERIWI